MNPNDVPVLIRRKRRGEKEREREKGRIKVYE